ncbi:unnamed protein product [Spirodela intermedia]|uniref:Fucosyltransferase n=1 Tax=Spirodela intermedia TaxID=51605 RepID=A0ABN7EAG3_SPIIN|nr:unnamed protein product [Spirodela intermedia]
MPWTRDEPSYAVPGKYVKGEQKITSPVSVGIVSSCCLVSPVNLYQTCLLYFERLQVLANSSCPSKQWHRDGASLPFIYVPITYRYDGNDKRFLLESDQEFLVRIPWMVLSGDNYFVPALFLNRMLEPELSRLFPDKETVFHHLSRTFNKEQSPLDQVVDQVINCTLSEGLLPPVALDRPVVSANLNNSKVVLITTLHSQFSDRTRNMYCEHPSKGGVLVSIHQPSHEEWQQMELENHDLKAWAEIYLLCFADVLVTSAESAFGYIAHGPAGIRPWILKSSYSGRMPEPSCVRDTSIYPCFHSLPWYDCESCKWLSDSGKEISYVTHCRDFPHGIELVGQID